VVEQPEFELSGPLFPGLNGDWVDCAHTEAADKATEKANRLDRILLMLLSFDAYFAFRA
jgi:hypothetical protein